MDNLIQLKLQYPPYDKRPGNRFKDLTGMHIGMTTFLYRTTDLRKGKPRYVCKCDCGKIFVISKSYSDCFYNGQEANVSCGNHRTDDLTGQRYGSFVVLEKLKKEERPTNEQNRCYYRCQCDCGNIFILSTFDITNRTACPQCNKEKARLASIIDETGNQYGQLTVLQLYDDGQRQVPTKWICQCTCGNKVLVEGRHLREGTTTSCGCSKYSANESKIAAWLKDLNKLFIVEKKFDEINSFRFDFYVDNNYVIEYDGEHHFLKNHRFTDEIHQRDMIKNKFCFDHNIPIIRIPFTERKNYTIQDLIPETSRFLLTPDNINNYYQLISNL